MNDNLKYEVVPVTTGGRAPRQALLKVVLAVSVAGALGALVLTGTVSAASKTTTCTRQGFVAAVRYGPSFGLAVSGTLRLRVTRSGDATGTITNNVGRRFRVVGHVMGRSISLLIRFRTTGWISGTGTLERPWRRCSGFIGGAFAGPSEGDIGDWDCCGLTSSFGNGMQSSGSPPVGTNLPVVRNPRYDNGQLFGDTTGSFINTGAVLIVEPAPPYAPEYVPLFRDDQGSSPGCFSIPCWVAGPGTPSGIPLRTLIPRGGTVTLKVMNPDGKTSLGVRFTRP